MPSRVIPETQNDLPHDQTTEQFGALNGVKGPSVRGRLNQTGSYFGVVPTTRANGRLAWPAIQVTKGRK